MELETYTDADRWLLTALETDPAVMADLGGPWPIEEIPTIHLRRLAHIANGAWVFTVRPEPDEPAVGTVTLWRSELNGETISEVGWMILAEHQGRGYGTEALRLLLDRARTDGSWGAIHALPGLANAASNALCRRFGFEQGEPVEIKYGGRTLTCNHWVLPG